MGFAKGCRKPDPVKLAKKLRGHLHPQIAARLEAAKPLPPAADKLPARPRTDQGQSGSCTWGSSSIAIYVACIALGIPLGFVPSQRLGYAATRAKERPVVGGKMDALTDSGADLEDVYTVAGEYGVRPMIVDTSPDGRFYDIWSDADVQGLPSPPPGNLNDEPDTGDLETAAGDLVKLDVAKYAIDPSDPNRSDLMAASLDASPPVPIVACGYVDTSFENLQPGQVAGAPNLADPNKGGHAFWFSAYRTNAKGEREWKLENSWGKLWAELGYTRADGAQMPGGFCWVSEAFVQACWALYPLSVTVLKGAA
jgi:hypothetical protein